MEFDVKFVDILVCLDSCLKIFIIEVFKEDNYDCLAIVFLIFMSPLLIFILEFDENNSLYYINLP